jgi:exopolysaccharide biosynthesis polyprenyl glycosylphosphotransferase
MSVYGTLLRRHFEPLVLSVQVVVDLLVLLLSCWLGYLLGSKYGHIPVPPGALLPPEQIYQDLSLLIAAVCLVTFHTFGMYSPTKSLLNMDEFKAIAKSTVVSFLVLLTLLLYLRGSPQAEGQGWLLQLLLPLHSWIRPKNFDVDSLSRVTILFTFGLILVLTTASRFASFKVIQRLHRRRIGNRNVLILGAGDIGRKLNRKFELVPTLGLNLVGFVDDDPARVGQHIDRCSVLGTSADLERLIALHKVSEVFVAVPEMEEERLLELLARLDHLGVQTRVVPRFHTLLSFKVRIESLDSIPLITRAESRPGVVAAVGKRALDLSVSLFVLLLTLPLWALAALLIKRESPGPVFFTQSRIGREGQAFRMYKFRTMHQHLSGDAPTPRSSSDPRVTNIGRWLRRFSLDELPQFLNVLAGDMSVVGPRPEMQFIVDKYNTLERERLRVKPGITGLWQISYARQMAIHENLDYDLYYIEHQSLLLDLVIISLTLFAVVKGTGAY